MPVDWENGEKAAGQARFALCQKLCALRKSEPVLTQGEVVWLDSDQPKAVLVFVRKVGVKETLTVFNLKQAPVKVAVTGAGEAFTPLLSEGATGCGQGVFELAAHGYFVGKR